MTTDKRAAAIAALGGPEKARELLRGIAGDKPPMPGVAQCFLTNEASRAIVTIALAALEADDGRALLRQLLAELQERHGNWISLARGAAVPTSSIEGSYARAAGLSDAIGCVERLLAAPEQPAPHWPGCFEGWLWGMRDNGDPAKFTPDRVIEEFEKCRACTDPACKPEQPAPEPAAPHADDEARIADWETGARYVECEDPKAPPAADVRALGYFLVRSDVDEAVALMREFAARPKVVTRHKVTQTGEHFCQTQCEERKALAAGKAKAEALAHERAAVFRKVEEQNAVEIADLRKKLADAKAELAAVDAAIADRGVPERDCTLPLPERVSNIISELKNWRHEAGTAQAEVERLTGIIDDTTNTEATNADTVADLRAKLAEAEQKKDAFFQSLSRAMETLDHIRDNHVQGDDVSDHEGIAQAVDRIAAERDAALAAQNARAVEELEALLLRPESRVLGEFGQFMYPHINPQAVRDRIASLRAAKPDPAAEPVPAAADAKRDTDDEVLRDMLCQTLPVQLHDVVHCLRVLCRRALEVRP